jgi:hypothetical protein
MSVWTSTTACAIGHAENVPEIVVNAGNAYYWLRWKPCTRNVVRQVRLVWRLLLKYLTIEEHRCKLPVLALVLHQSNPF